MEGNTNFRRLTRANVEFSYYLLHSANFGTSCTKIVIRDRELKQAYAVPFQSLTVDGYPYFLPSVIYLNKDGEISIAGGDFQISDVKLNLMRGPSIQVCSIDQENIAAKSIELATGYLAIAIREARNWFLSNYGDVYRKLRIDWHVNIGVPSSTQEFRQLGPLFRKVALAAWCGSTVGGRLNLEIVRDCISNSERSIENKEIIGNEGLHPDLVNSFPEVISEVVGYARSDMRIDSDPMHLLVDVGATTLDIAVFVLHKTDGFDRYSVLVNDVSRMGALVLHKNRIGYLRDRFETELDAVLEIPSEIIPVPNSKGYIMELVPDIVDEHDKNFLDRSSDKVKEMLKATREHRNPLAVIHQDLLPVFICGGGSGIPIYKSAVNRSQIALGPVKPEFRFLELPKPRQLEAPDMLTGDYHRISVAYGLSHTIFEIGEAIPPEDIENVEPVKTTNSLEDRYVGPEVM